MTHVRTYVRRMLGGRASLAVCAFLLTTVFLMALLAPWIAPHDPNKVQLALKLQPPSAEHLLGTDHLGRDILSRIMFGARISVGLVSFVFAASVVIGVAVGTLAGYIGGWLDQLVMRICDGLLAFPNLVLVLGIVGIMGPGIVQIVFALLLVQWVYYARMSRGLVMYLRVASFVAAAKVCGSGLLVILRKHILPHIFPQIVVIGTLEMGWAIMDISALSFLGLGIQPPAAEWGAMINEGRAFIRSAPHLLVYPGICIFLVVVAFNGLGESMARRLGVTTRSVRSEAGE